MTTTKVAIGITEASRSNQQHLINTTTGRARCGKQIAESWETFPEVAADQITCKTCAKALTREV